MGRLSSFASGNQKLGFVRGISALDPSDPYYRYTYFLMKTFGTTGGTNNTFVDSSNYSANVSIVRSGDCPTGTHSPFYPPAGEWSWYNEIAVDNVGGYATIPANNDFVFGTGDFTIEFWYLFTGRENDYSRILSINGGYGSQSDGIEFTIYPTGFKADAHGGSGTPTTNWFSVFHCSDNTYFYGWHHYALVKSGSTVTAFYDGVANASQSSVTRNFSGNLGITIFGNNTQKTADIAYGYISNLRIIKGQALYTGNFTPTSQPLTATAVGNYGASGNVASSITGTVSLLTCQNPTFTDNSTTPKTITPSQHVTSRPVSPVVSSPVVQYDPTLHAGSVYTDGTGDALTGTWSGNALTAAAPGTGNWTMEVWMYNHTNDSGFNAGWFFMGGSAGRTDMSLFTTNDRFVASSTQNQVFNVAYEPPYGRWCHVAMVRNSNTIYAYIDGVQIASGAWPDSQTNSTFNLSGSANCKSYWSNYRIVIGTAVYTGAFTPPRLAPLKTSGSASASCYPSTTNVNTSFASSQCVALLNFTNQSVKDVTGNFNIQTVGDSTTSTTRTKFASTSVYLDGTGDCIFAPSQVNNNDLSVWNQDWTIEGWYNFNTKPSNNYNVLFSIGDVNDNNPRMLMYFDTRTATNTGLRFTLINSATNYGVDGTGSSWLSTNTWYHLCAMRYDNKIRIFINGVLEGYSATVLTHDSLPFPSGIVLGREPGANDGLYNGYIEDARFTRAARYPTTATVVGTSVFTPPGRAPTK